MSDLETGKLIFVEHYLPPLLSGEYTVAVTQNVSLGAIDFQGVTISSSTQRQYGSGTVTFFVRGERFFLKPEEIQSFFPPANVTGDFTNVLPHVVLTKKVLPWEWTLTGGAQIPTATGDVATWMALLLFDAEDPTPDTVVGTLSDLLHPPAGVVTYPNLKLVPGESATDPVVYIDVPVALFSQVVPSAADLVHLAHSRQVAPNNKPSDPSNAQAEYSVLIANRLPHGQKSTVHLVCLEGMASYLPGSGQGIPESAKAIRLASLKSWQFTAAEEEVSFAGTLRKVIDPNLPSTLRLPCSGSPGQAVESALAMGYTACAHQTRLGASTVSWYRGPLVPCAPNAATQLVNPARNADALLRYNPNTGMFDTSYAAAWQLGRLLALQNKEYAVALYQWKHASQTAQQQQPALPAVVSNWLGRLALLYGIPFNYLVPDERMLPPESLRFFQLDPFWMDCVMDGAFSIGRSTSATLDHDTAVFDNIRRSAIAAARQVRINWITAAGGSANPAPGDGTITGFLLRSEVVPAYPGMEVLAYSSTDPNEPRALLRFETVAPNLLLCLFDGSIGKVLIRQAPEGLHFGLDSAGTNKYQRGFRSISDGNESTSLAPVPVNFRSGGMSVIEIDQLASSMATALAGELGQKPFTSGIFALEMVEGVHEVFFIHKS